MKNGEAELDEGEELWKQDFIQTMVEKARSHLSNVFFSESNRPFNDVLDKIHEKYGFANIPTFDAVVPNLKKPSNIIIIHTKCQFIQFWDADVESTQWPGLSTIKESGDWNKLEFGTSKITFIAHNNDENKPDEITINVKYIFRQ